MQYPKISLISFIFSLISNYALMKLNAYDISRVLFLWLPNLVIVFVWFAKKSATNLDDKPKVKNFLMLTLRIAQGLFGGLLTLYIVVRTFTPH